MIKGLAIGKHKLKLGLFLAPMAGITDSAFRAVCRRMGAEYTVSEMVCAKALCFEQKCKKEDGSVKSGTLARVCASDYPMAVQIFGSEPEYIAEATRLIVSGEYRGCESELAPAAIDINMGCPVHKIVANREGSALMREPRLVGEVVEAAVGAAGDIPVTVKIRAGWDSETKNAVEIAKIAEASGAAAICVHGRTRSQMYSGLADRRIIADVKAAVGVPVIGNGDIVDAASAVDMLEVTGCDGIMIGRGAMGNPWIFSEISACLEGRRFVPPTREEIAGVALSQLRAMIEDNGERIGVSEARKHLCKYLRGFSGASEARGKLNYAESYDQMKAIFDELLEKNR